MIVNACSDVRLGSEGSYRAKRAVKILGGGIAISVVV
jgi:hypothetical protein